MRIAITTLDISGMSQRDYYIFAIALIADTIPGRNNAIKSALAIGDILLAGEDWEDIARSILEEWELYALAAGYLAFPDGSTYVIETLVD